MSYYAMVWKGSCLYYPTFISFYSVICTICICCFASIDSDFPSYGILLCNIIVKMYFYISLLFIFFWPHCVPWTFFLILPGNQKRWKIWWRYWCSISCFTVVVYYSEIYDVHAAYIYRVCGMWRIFDEKTAINKFIVRRSYSPKNEGFPAWCQAVWSCSLSLKSVLRYKCRKYPRCTIISLT